MNKKQLLFVFVVSPMVGLLTLSALMLTYDAGVIQSELLGFAWLALVVALFWWLFVRTYKRLGD